MHIFAGPAPGCNKGCIDYNIIPITKFLNLIGSLHAVFDIKLTGVQLRCPIINITPCYQTVHLNGFLLYITTKILQQKLYILLMFLFFQFFSMTWVSIKWDQVLNKSEEITFQLRKRVTDLKLHVLSLTKPIRHFHNGIILPQLLVPIHFVSLSYLNFGITTGMNCSPNYHKKKIWRILLLVIKWCHIENQYIGQ